MSLYGMAMFHRTPYYACKYGFSQRVGYKQCDICPIAETCDILEAERVWQESDAFFTKMFAERPDLYDWRDYEINDAGHWVYNGKQTKKKQRELEKQARAEDARRIVQAVKNFFHQVADWFDRLFK